MRRLPKKKKSSPLIGSNGQREQNDKTAAFDGLNQ